MKSNTRGTRRLRGAAMLASLLLMSTAASATEGYFQLGFGPRQNGLGGTGVADSRDAMALALNPAGIAGLDTEAQLGAALFMPYRGYETSGPGFVAPGNVESYSNIFIVPNAAYVRAIDSDSSVGITLYGNGGMNTSYDDVANPACPPGGSGVYCGGAAGVDLMQAFISAGYARKFGPVKLGIAPTLAVQRFKANGLRAFSAGSVDASHLTNNGYDYSFGGGVRGGAELSVLDNLRLGVSGQTKMWMSKFHEYSGLFENGGDFDIPASVTAGMAFDVTQGITLLADYQHIFYSGVGAVSNSSTTLAPFGSKGGPGFGWHDVDVFKIGAEWRVNDKWTLRGGYAYSSNPIDSGDVTLNILAPGVVQHHFTGGFAYQATAHDGFEFSGIYVPESTVTGDDMFMPGRPITLKMHQFQMMGGWTHTF
jgi:long-chain fatty acid transport protein